MPAPIKTQSPVRGAAVDLYDDGVYRLANPLAPGVQAQIDGAAASVAVVAGALVVTSNDGTESAPVALPAASPLTQAQSDKLAAAVTQTELAAALQNAQGTPSDVVLSRGDTAAARPDLLSVTFKGHVVPASMRNRVDELQTIPAGVLAIAGTGPDGLSVAVGTGPATKGLASVEVEAFLTGQSASTSTIAVANPQAAETVALPANLFPAGSAVRQWNARARGLPAPLLNALGEVVESAVDLASDWSPSVTFAVAALSDTEAPVWSTIPAVTGAPGSADVVYNLAQYLTDDSGQAPTVALVGSPAGVTLSGLTLTISRASAVTDTITLSATDAASNEATTTVSRTVAASAPTTVAPLDFRFEEASGDFLNSGSLGGTITAPVGTDYTGDGVNLPDDPGIAFGGAAFASSIGRTTRGAPGALYVRMTRTGGERFTVGFAGQFNMMQDYDGSRTRFESHLGTNTGDSLVAQAVNELVEFFGHIVINGSSGRRIDHYQRRNGGAWIQIGDGSDIGDPNDPVVDGPFLIGDAADAEQGARRVHRIVLWGQKSGGGDVTLADLATLGVQI